MSTLFGIVSALLLLFEVILIGRVLLDWVSPLAASSTQIAAPMATVRTTLHKLTEPVLVPVRRVLPPLNFGQLRLDLAVTVVLLLVVLLRFVLP